MDGGGGFCEGAEGGTDDRAGLGVGDEAEGDFGDDAEHAFAADEEPGEVEALAVFVAAAAGVDDGAVGEDDFEAKDVVAGDPVLEAAWAAGVGGDIAAEGAFAETGRVGGVVPAEFTDFFLEFAGDDAGLDDGDPVSGVDFEDAVHAFHGEDDAAVDGDAAADVADPAAADGDGDFVPCGESHNGADVGRGFGEDDGVRFF